MNLKKGGENLFQNLRIGLKVGILGLGVVAGAEKAVASNSSDNLVGKGGGKSEYSYRPNMSAAVTEYFKDELTKNQDRLYKIESRLLDPEFVKKLKEENNLDFINSVREKSTARVKQSEKVLADPEGYYQSLEATVNQQKQQLLDHFSSPEFLEKIKAEFGFSETEATAYVVRLKDNLQTVEIKLLPSDSVIMEGMNLNTRGCYNYEKHALYIPFDMFEEETVLHEMIHSAYRSQDELSDRFEKLAKKTFRANPQNRVAYNEYLSEESEMAVRKKILDLKLEEWGIKKYGEKFTKEHYQKLMERYKENKLTPNLKDIIETFDIDGLIKMMNTTAYNLENQSSKEVADNLV